MTDEELADVLAFVVINGLAEAAGEDTVTADEWACLDEDSDENRAKCAETRRQVVEAVGVPVVAKLRELGLRPARSWDDAIADLEAEVARMDAATPPGMSSTTFIYTHAIARLREVGAP